MAKDQEKTDKSKEEKKASDKKKDSKKSKKTKDVKDTKKTGSSNKDRKSGKEEQAAVQENARPWGSQNPPISGPGSRTAKMNNRRNQESHPGSSDSNRNFFSSLNLNTNHLLGVAGVVAGGALLFRGARGEWPFTKKNLEEVNLHSKVTIDAPREELYAYWRNLENLPNFMSHLEEVEEIDQKRSKWTAEIPGGLGHINWDAVIDEERENEFLSWRSLPGAEIENSGHVRFEDELTGKGTIVETTISYRPPAGGELGEKAMKLFNPAFERTVKRDLKQFKKHMENKGESKKKRKKNPIGKLLY